MKCSICFRGEGQEGLQPTLVGDISVDNGYPGQVCEDCNLRAANVSGEIPATDSVNDSGDNPVYIDGLKCWRRYRFGGYITMRDDAGCRTLDEFYGTTAFPEWSQSLLRNAHEALIHSGKPVASGVGAPIAGERYLGAEFNHQGATWVVCRTSMVSANRQLLDATVALKAAVGASRALAILDAPEGVTGAHSAPHDYVVRYRSATWHGLGLVFGTAVELEQGWRVSPVAPNSQRGWLDDLSEQVSSDLLTRRVDIESLSGSRDAENVVRPIFDAALRTRGFTPTSTSYQSFWCRPQADGVWIRSPGNPHRVHLEVKLGEDENAPLCQVFEGLGVADAVIQVRLVKSAARKRLDTLFAANPWLPVLKARLEARLPLRFIEVG